MKRLFSVYGDSISTFEGVTPDGWSIFYTGEQREATGVQTPADTWWMQVINHFDGELLANAAWSGCVCEGNVFPQGASERRIAALERDGKTPDDILIYIGINDYGLGIVLRADLRRIAERAGRACGELSRQGESRGTRAQWGSREVRRIVSQHASHHAREVAESPHLGSNASPRAREGSGEVDLTSMVSRHLRR